MYSSPSGEVAFHEGIPVPVHYVAVEPPDVQKPYGYARLLHEVDEHGSAWVMFDFDIKNMAWRVSRHLRQHGLLERYEMVWAVTRIYLRRKPGLKPYAELVQ